MSKDTTVYSDEKIKDFMSFMRMRDTENATAPMLQQLMDERDAILKDLKALEVEVREAICDDVDGITISLNGVLIDLIRSEKYDTETKD